MHVRIATAGFMDGRHARGGQDNHGDRLRDGRLAIGGEITRFGEGVIRIVGFASDLLGGDQGHAGGEGVVDYGEGEEGDFILFRQTDRRGGAGESGAKGALEGRERNLEVDGVGGRGRFNGVFFEDRVLWEDLERGGRGGCDGWGGGPWKELCAEIRFSRMRTREKSPIIRPYLCARALLWNDGEADLVVVKPDPNHLAKEGKR